MNYSLDITESFENDVGSVIEYISHKLYNPDASERLLRNTENTVSKIAENPFLYPVYHDETISEKGYRYAVISKYLIFYLIDEASKTIHISRFLYGGQNVVEIL